MTQPTLVNLLINKYSQEFNYSPLAVKLHRCIGSCNTLNDFSSKVCAPNKTENLNLSVFSMITGINKLKTLTKHISFECNCSFDGRKCNSDQWWNNGKCPCECKKSHAYETYYVWSLSTCTCENGKYLTSIMDDSVFIWDEVIESNNKE